jgi:Polyketide synthase dehydratase
VIRNSFFLDFLHLRPEGFSVTIPGSHWCFADHVVRGHMVLPAAAYLELVLAGVAKTYPTFRAVAVEDCFWMRPLIINGFSLTLMTTIRQVGRRLRFDIADADQSYACGWISEVIPPLKTEETSARIQHEVAAHGARIVSAASAYATFERMGIEYGPKFRNICKIETAGLMAVANINAKHTRDLTFCTLLDCAFQSGMTIRSEEPTDSLMPFSLGCLLLHGEPSGMDQGTYVAATEKFTDFRTSIFIEKDDIKHISVIDLGVKISKLLQA